MIKHIIDPFKFETNPGGFVGGNLSTVGFYSLGINEIPIVLDANNFVLYADPFNETLGFDKEFLRCMAWNASNMSFADDGSCGYNMAWEVIPCQSCTSYNLINTTVSMCRISHLSRFGAVYQPSSIIIT